MAKVKNPFLSTEARGSVGGCTASRNSMGQYIKSKASPCQPRTKAQQAQRYRLQKLSRAYQDLSATNIQSWIDFASTWPITDAFGDSITITGMDWFISLNSRLDSLGVSISSTPPLNPNPDWNPTITFSQLSQADVIMSISQVPTGNQAVWVQYSGNLPKTSQFAKASLKQRSIFGAGLSLSHSLISYADLSPNDSLRQITAFAVDESGRATPKIRETIYPV